MRRVGVAILLLVLASASAQHQHHHRDPDRLSAVRGYVVDYERRLWDEVIDPRWHEVTAPNAHGPSVEVARRFTSLADEISSVGATDDWLRGTPVDGWWVWGMMRAEKQAIDKAYDAFADFLRQQAHETVFADQEEWLQAAEPAVTSGPKSVANISENMHNLVVHGHLYSQIAKESERHMCSLQQSQSQLLYNMYNAILLTEIKGYAVRQFSWMLLKLYGKGNYSHESETARKQFENRTALTMASAKSALANADTAMWRCDPQFHTEGETFLQLTRLLQGYIENEVDMNDQNTCRENCAFYSIAENHGCFKDMFCSRQPACTGKILRCRYIDSDMDICPAPRGSPRRYDWIEYENGRVFGRKMTCLTGKTKVDSWWRWLFWHCSYCMCLCDQSGPLSDRFFSLKEVKANVRSNKVIIGLRFVKVNRVIHLQIAEGVLLPAGEIDKKSVSWKKPEELDVRRSRMGVDYHQMSDVERAIDLDDLKGAPDHVLTGVRFRKVGAHLNFEIQTMPFNFATGTLIPEKAVWLSNDNTGASNTPRAELHLVLPDIPTKSFMPSRVDSTDDQFVKFTNSDFDADAAQTTVPFLDAQPVIPAIPVPLSGAGIYHKGQRYFGGYVAPKVFTYDFSIHMHETALKPTVKENLVHEVPHFDVRVS